MVRRTEGKEIETLRCSGRGVTKKNILRVAVYARVSTLEESQEDSFETQREYYEKLILSEPGMTLAGVYGDRGISGLGINGRTEFLRMLEDCRNGKIDLIITRSVSRFSRNISECVETVNKLRSLGIPIRFEKEGFTTTDDNSDMFFNVLAILAQEESGSLSRRMTWAVERRAEMGRPIRKCPYGYKKESASKNEDNSYRGWRIDEEEARRIRKAFEMASNVCPYDAIIEQLDLMEKAAGSGVSWTQPRLYKLLLNEAYRGDVLTHKTYTVDYIAKKRAHNKGERTRYYIKEHHEPIVDIAVFERVQTLVSSGLLNSLAHRMREEHKSRTAKWKKEHKRNKTSGARTRNIITVLAPKKTLS